MTLHTSGLRLVLAAVVVACGSAHAGEKEETEKRVKELIRVIDLAREQGGKQWRDAAEDAKWELVRMGEPAAAGLVEAGVAYERHSNPDAAAHFALAKIGKPAVPAIRAKWGDLNDEQRWRFMPLLEKHDPDSVRTYARNCLDCKDEDIQIRAWHFVLLAKDEKVKERYFGVLEGKRQVPDGIRLVLMPNVEPRFDEERENKILIALLDRESWLAKGKGVPPALGPQPSWEGNPREPVIRIIGARKVKDRDGLVKAAAPALLGVLQEKGKGQGNLAAFIVPILLEANYAKAVPELELIAECLPQSGRFDEQHPHNPKTYDQIRNLAADAAAKLKENEKR